MAVLITMATITPAQSPSRAEGLRIMQQMVAEDSHNFFMDKLPVEGIKVVWADISKKPDYLIGQTIPYPLNHFVIKIDRATNPALRQARMTQIHEECHIYTWERDHGNHGPEFESCMQMVALQGGFRDLW